MLRQVATVHQRPLSAFRFGAVYEIRIPATFAQVYRCTWPRNDNGLAGR
jgi:hypothetical protein